MRKFSFLFFIAAMSLTACKQDFKKGDKGLEYKIISEGSGTKAKYGNFLRMQIRESFTNGKTDTLIFDSRNSTPNIFSIDSMQLPSSYVEIFSQSRKGDSIVFRTALDSLIKHGANIPNKYSQKGYYDMVTFKVLDVFSTKELAINASKADFIVSQKKDSIEKIKQLGIDDNKLKDYFKKNGININDLKKSPLGVYIKETQIGTGSLIDTSFVAKINYVGSLMNGKIFDSTSNDLKKLHNGPITISMNGDQSLGFTVIPGWTDALKSLRKGSKATIYIPSTLAYGKDQRSEDIIPNSILIFNIDVIDLIPNSIVRNQVEGKIKTKNINKQKFYDSIAKVRPVTPKTNDNPKH